MSSDVNRVRRQRLVSTTALPIVRTNYSGDEKKQVNEWGLTLDLYSHQKNSVQRMEFLETNRKREYTTEESTMLIESNFGILNDKVGSGKSLVCISLISREINSPNFNKESREQDYVETVQMHGNSIYSISKKTIKKILYIPVTVIAVNNAIIGQWDYELSRSNLLYKIVSKNSDINNLPNYLHNVNVIVVSKTIYNRFVGEFNILGLYNRSVINTYCIHRLIVDEYCRRGSFPEIKTDFCWLVSATVPGIYDFNRLESRINYINICLQSSGSRSETRMSGYYDWKNIIVKNTEEEINRSFLVAKILNIVYIARGDNNRLLDLNINVSQEVRRMIVADNIKGAIEAIGGNVEKDDLLTIIIRREEDEIRRIEASITYHATLSQDDKKNEYMEKLAVVKKNLENIRQKVERDEGANECPLCCDELIDKCLVSCCNSIICASCTAKVVKSNNRCPFCRKDIDLSKTILSTQKPHIKPKKPVIKSKVDYILEIIEKKPTGKFIIFSEFSSTYQVIQETLKKTGLKYAEIKGTSAHKNSILQKYKYGDINILFLNCRNDGAGINLPETTDIIIYHRISSSALETQLLGRALRLGRTSELTVHRLMYKQEYDLVDDNSTIGYLYDQEEISDEEDQSLSNSIEMNGRRQHYDEMSRIHEERDQVRADYELALRLQRTLF